LALQLSLYLLSLHSSIIFFLNDQTVVMSGMYSEKTKNFLKEIRSILCFSSSKSERPYNCCKKVFKHNDYFSFMSASENCFVKICELKNDTKRFPIN
jgi:hypothetical protein